LQRFPTFFVLLPKIASAMLGHYSPSTQKCPFISVARAIKTGTNDTNCIVIN